METFVYALEDILVPLGICVAMPVLIVWLVVRHRSHLVDRKTEIVLKAIENGSDVDTSSIFEKDRTKTVKMKLLAKLETGVLAAIIGAGLMLSSLAIDSALSPKMLVIGGILAGIGIGFIVVYLVGRKSFAAEIAAEEKSALERKDNEESR